MIRLRFGDEWIGVLVVLAAALFIGVIIQAGLLRDWFKPTAVLRIMLPEAGVAGLAVGADVEILGTKAGVVRRIVINPTQQMYAEAEIDQQAQAFIRRDSKALLRRRFGIAGAAYIELSRGSGAPIDWRFAVVDATTERDPSESIGALIDQVREKVFPILDDVGRTTHALAEVMEGVRQGKGNLGELMVDDKVMREVEGIATDARAVVAGLGRIMSQLEGAARDVGALTQAARSPDQGVPALLKRSDQILTTLQGAMKELASAAERLPPIARNVESATQNLPALLTQVQLTAQELERLIVQLRGTWLLGGGAPAADPKRLPPTQVRP
jgi:phospholipid/cholesterol/gamma-HCH transport system substrate-binding protein